MILRIILFFSYAILVSTNTGFSVIPQTYPIYQQNSYANPVVSQPNNIATYLQSTIAQNQSPPLDLSPSNLKQVLLNRILSSPSLQSILGPNFGSYGSNLVDFNNNPIAQNSVNNYFEAPTLYSNDLNKNNVDFETEKPKKSKRKSPKSRRIQEESDNNQNCSSKSAKRKDKHIQTVENSTETSKKSKKRSRKQNTDVSSQNETKNKETESNANRKTKRRKNKETEQSKNDSTDKEIKAENSKSERRRKKKPKSNDSTEKVSSEQQTTPRMAPKEIKEGINVVTFNEGVVEENRVPRNPKLQGNDLLNTALPLSENSGTNFMKTLSQFDNNPYMNNFFANYENIYQSMLASGLGRDEKKEKVKTVRRKRTRKHDKRKTTQTKNGNSTEAATILATSTPKVSPKINIVTTERTIIINEKTHSNVDTIPKGEGLKPFDKILDLKEQILKENRYEENAQENSNRNTPDGYYSNAYIDDYYPLFTDNAAYNANNKEVYVKHLGDTKYYYAIDKGNPDTINRRRFEHFQFPERVVKDYEVDKHYEDIEQEGMRNLKTDIEEEVKEETKFRSPPHLELPDFQTRQIDKSEINPKPIYNFEEINNIHRFVGDKSQIKDKSLRNNKKKSNSQFKDESKSIETVFARSKVVKYGSAISSEEEVSTDVGITTPTPLDETYFKDEGTTYVLAKSLDYPETYW